MKKFIKIFALCLTLALMLSVSALAAGLVVDAESLPTKLELWDAETLNLNITGSYEADKLVSLEVKAADGTVVLVQQAVCDENDKFVLSGIMSDEVEIGSYTAIIGATGADAQTYGFEVGPNLSTVTINSSGGNQNCMVKVAVAGEEPEVWSGPKDYPMGTKLTLTAVSDDTHEFLYWKEDNADGYPRIISENESTSITVGRDTKIEAVFAEQEEQVINVTFMSNNQIVLLTTTEASIAPADPYIAGYRFKGWFLKGKLDEEVDKNELFAVEKSTTYVAGFTVSEDKYTVTVNGVPRPETYVYNTKVTVEAEPTNEEGLVFTNWTRDGEVVSYDRSYSFFVNGKTDLVANYDATGAEEKVVLVMAKPTQVITIENGEQKKLNKIAFYAERNVPADYTVLETGIILSQEEDFDLMTDGITTAKATSTSNNGQFTVRKKDVEIDDTWYGRAYLIYEDKAGNIYREYSRIGSCTISEISE